MSDEESARVHLESAIEALRAAGFSVGAIALVASKNGELVPVLLIGSKEPDALQIIARAFADLSHQVMVGDLGEHH